MKILKNRLFIFILRGILFSSITAFAVTTMNARDIAYTKKDGTETTVDSVLNDLYSKTDENSEVSVIAPKSMRYAIIENKNYDYFTVSLTSSGSGATCTAYRANVSDKTVDIVFDNDYSTDDAANRIYFVTAGNFCQYKVSYHN